MKITGVIFFALISSTRTLPAKEDELISRDVDIRAESLDETGAQERDNCADSGESMTPARVWVFAVSRGYPPFNKLDEEKGQVVGVALDVMREACDVARQRCEFMFLKSFHSCWDSEQGLSPGLTGGWFDGCASAVHTFERDLVHGFSRSYSREVPSSLYLRRNDNLRAEDVRREGNEIPIGFIRNWWIDNRCLGQHGIRVNEERMRVYDSPKELMEGLRRGEIRLAFNEEHDFDDVMFKPFDIGRTIHCAVAGTSVMVRKGDVELLDWLNPALDRVIAGPKYARSCYVWEKILGMPAFCFDDAESARDFNGGRQP